MSHIKQIDFILDLLDNGDYSLDQAKQEVAKTFNGESTPTWDSVDEKGNDLTEVGVEQEKEEVVDAHMQPSGTCENPSCRKYLYTSVDYCNDDCRNSA